MKKTVSMILAVLLMASLLVGCGSTSANTATTAATAETTAAAGTDAAAETTAAAAEIKTVTPGVLTVATSPDFAPMEFTDPTKQGQDMYVGFDITLAKYIAESLGLELQIMPMSFDACQTAVYAGTADMAASGFSWTEDRAQNYNTSDYYHAGDNEDEQVLITLASNGDKYATAEGLKGAKIGAQNASLQQSLATEQLPDSELVLFTDLGTGVLQLKNGDFDCIAVAKGNGDAIIANNPEIATSGFKFVVDEKYTGNVILLQKGNDGLTEAVNAALAASKDQWDTWYNEAKAISGIEISYDDQGNVAN
ncbi:transporter substrate-binding domain-containing protein [Pseudoflavonifractor sp. MSJ-30]|uniref:transporter substrate-binding domain-containing protein n=1 Tax=Pseudoflavonifractor sp. MSJ-30 TaxID=2841525 RepID=UPI001C11843E|nr:transporter substrate-binding domain-containing protein [Pseudoflavonifractor sp. MSJ-30]MBU5451595.1 transporter substrate-binding domain-containing protein [Pseudoflavonifractor sp. MSJ-30]